MRTTREENAALGTIMAAMLGKATAPVVLMIPKRGVSALDAPGKPFFDPQADAALFDSLVQGLAGHPVVRLGIRDEHINDPAFADAAARALLDLLASSESQSSDHVPKNAQ